MCHFGDGQSIVVPAVTSLTESSAPYDISKNVFYYEDICEEIITTPDSNDDTLVFNEPDVVLKIEAALYRIEEKITADNEVIFGTLAKLDEKINKLLEAVGEIGFCHSNASLNATEPNPSGNIKSLLPIKSYEDFEKLENLLREKKNI